jgi:hypothetical protein
MAAGGGSRWAQLELEEFKRQLRGSGASVCQCNLAIDRVYKEQGHQEASQQGVTKSISDLYSLT